MRANAFISEGDNRVGLSSYDKATLAWNADGSVELFFGPEAPAGKAASWIPRTRRFADASRCGSQNFLMPRCGTTGG
jgi:hypothetical protein